MKIERGGFRMLQHEQRRRERIHDAYRSEAKLAGPARCRDCGAVYRRGRWTWGPAGEAPRPVRCPACSRIRDAMPAGVVRMAGEYHRTHHAEVLRRVRRCEADEMATHPLQRIISVSVADPGGELVVTTTDGHLARRIGEALVKSFKGRAEFAYGREDDLLRVSWSRD